MQCLECDNKRNRWVKGVMQWDWVTPWSLIAQRIDGVFSGFKGRHWLWEDILNLSRSE